MAWNIPGSGNNNKDDKDPWTGKPKQSGPPDLEAMLRKLQQKLALLLKGKLKFATNPSSMLPRKINSLGAGIIIIFLALLWGLWGIFMVQPSEQAVILRLGKYVETLGPGLHWLPPMIETAYPLDEQKINTYAYQTEMLTRDAKIVTVAIAVSYRINDAYAYLFNTVDPIANLQQATVSALRDAINHSDLNDILTTGKTQIRLQIQTQLNQILTPYHTGLAITDVTIQSARVPDAVKSAYDDVIKAQAEKQRDEDRETTDAAWFNTNAKGQAQILITEARAYQQQAVLRAQTEVAPFLALLPAYQKATAVTRERMYLETMETVLTDSNKVVIDSSGNNNAFYLPLEKLIPALSKESSTTTASTLPLNTNATTPAPTNQNTKGYSSITRDGGYQ